MRSANPNTHVIQPHAVLHGTAPSSSYWCGCTRAELAQRIQARRHQMDAATAKDIRYDQAIAATVSLRDASLYRKLGRERP